MQKLTEKEASQLAELVMGTTDREKALSPTEVLERIEAVEECLKQVEAIVALGGLLNKLSDILVEDDEEEQICEGCCDCCTDCDEEAQELKNLLGEVLDKSPEEINEMLGEVTDEAVEEVAKENTSKLTVIKATSLEDAISQLREAVAKQEGKDKE